MPSVWVQAHDAPQAAPPLTIRPKMGEGNRGFERIADDVSQQAVALEPFREILRGASLTLPYPNLQRVSSTRVDTPCQAA
jgi:hypothetical protein